MNLLVCISKTPDTTSKIRFDNEGKNFIVEGVQYILNPYDEWYSLVRAIEIREKLGGKVDVIHVGDSSSDILIRKSLAIGADAAFRIDDEVPNATSVAHQIAEFIKKSSYDIIFLGKESIDHNSSEVGSRLSELLGIPFVSYCNKLEIENDLIVCSIEIEGGVEIISLKTPFVLSAAKGLAEQRIPNMKGIIDAKKKPMTIISKIHVENNTELVNFDTPPPKSGVRMIDPNKLEEMVEIFKNELKII